MQTRLIRLVQLLSYFVVFLPFRLLFAFKVIRLSSDMTLPARRILAANHRGRLDPFLACSALPFKNFVALTPIFFMTAECYMDTALKRALLLPFGCYPAYKGKRALQTMLKTVELLEQGKTIFTFPEGRIVRKKARPKVGVAYLAKRTGAAVLPIHIARKNATGNIRQTVCIRIGRFSNLPPEKSHQKNARILLNRIYELAA